MVISVVWFGAGPVNVKVQTPQDESNPGWGLNGRVVAITCANAMASIKEVKEMLSEWPTVNASKHRSADARLLE